MFIKGMIIAFEGVDCSFKETNYKEFCNRLIKEKDSSINIFQESFPRYNMKSSFFIKEWLNGIYDRSMLKENPSIINTFYCLDRFDYWYGSNRINLLEQGNNCFIFDRYTYSSAFHNSTSGPGMYPSYDDFNFEYENFKIPKPHITVLMRMKDFSVLEESIRAKKEKDCNENDISFIRNSWEKLEQIVANTYNYSLNTGTEFVVIDCIDNEGNIKSKEQLAKDVWNGIGKASAEYILHNTDFSSSKKSYYNEIMKYNVLGGVTADECIRGYMFEDDKNID